MEQGYGMAWYDMATPIAKGGVDSVDTHKSLSNTTHPMAPTWATKGSVAPPPQQVVATASILPKTTPSCRHPSRHLPHQPAYSATLPLYHLARNTCHRSACTSKCTSLPSTKPHNLSSTCAHCSPPSPCVAVTPAGTQQPRLRRRCSHDIPTGVYECCR